MQAYEAAAAYSAEEHQLTRVTAVQIYEGAAAAYDALEHQLQGGGPYLFGERPCSLDAALLAQLAFHKHCPAAAPELQALVDTLSPYWIGIGTCHGEY